MRFEHKAREYIPEDKVYEILPEGIYDVKIHKISPSSDGSYFKIWFKVIKNDNYNDRMLFSLPIYKTHTKMK